MAGPPRSATIALIKKITPSDFFFIRILLSIDCGRRITSIAVSSVYSSPTKWSQEWIKSFDKMLISEVYQIKISKLRGHTYSWANGREEFPVNIYEIGPTT